MSILPKPILLKRLEEIVIVAPVIVARKATWSDASSTADRALTRVVAYGAAKAGVETFTRWLAVELARSYGAGLRVNAIAPGFFGNR